MMEPDREAINMVAKFLKTDPRRGLERAIAEALATKDKRIAELEATVSRYEEAVVRVRKFLNNLKFEGEKYALALEIDDDLIALTSPTPAPSELERAREKQFIDAAENMVVAIRKSASDIVKHGYTLVETTMDYSKACDSLVLAHEALKAIEGKDGV